MGEEQVDWRTRPALLVAGAVLAALVWTTVSGPLLRPLLGATGIPYARAVLTNLADLAVMSLLLGLAARAGPRRLFGLTGLAAPLGRPLIWAALLFIPAVLVAALSAPVSRDLARLDLVWQSAAFPALEEILYRGLAVGALIAWAGWRWWAAALAPAALFGLAHLGQGSDPAEAAGVVAITGAGGLLFGWLFVRWRANLWPAILLHLGLNSLWMVFALGETALGGWLGNGLRLVIVIAAVLLSLRMAPASRTRPAGRRLSSATPGERP